MPRQYSAFENGVFTVVVLFLAVPQVRWAVALVGVALAAFGHWVVGGLLIAAALFAWHVSRSLRI